jgi:hypothetical protein
MRMIGSLSISAALFAVGLCIVLPLTRPNKSTRYELSFWAVATLIVIALMAGLFPWFWSLPGVNWVQFPWRLMLIVDFSILTGLYLTRIRKMKPILDYVLCAVAITIGVCATVILVSVAPALTGDALARIEFTANNAPLPQWEAPEYLPRGYGSRGGGLPDYANDPLPGGADNLMQVHRPRLPSARTAIRRAGDRDRKPGWNYRGLASILLSKLAHRARAPDLCDRRPEAGVVHCTAGPYCRSARLREPARGMVGSDDIGLVAHSTDCRDHAYGPQES